MYKDHKIIAIAPAWNEQGKIGQVVKRIPLDLVDEILVVDDGSDDGTAQEAAELGAGVISLGAVRGVGAALRRGFEYAIEKGYHIVVILAGNNKDDPNQIIRLVQPIVDEQYDFVHGSRYLPGGRHGNMPTYRKVATRLHPILFSAAVGKRVTDSSNGFRAFRTTILDDKRINLWQEWLDQYDLEIYLYFQTIRYGFKVKEVPVTKIYPPKQLGYTKMPPITGWWSMLRPIFFLKMGLRS